MKYSILMPSYDPDMLKHEQFMAAIKSIEHCSKGRDYELIIRKNGDMSYGEAFNNCLKSSRGDYIIQVHDDMVIKDDQWLEKLSDPDYFCSPGISTFFMDGSDSPLWPIIGMPRWIFEKVGFLDEAYKHGLGFDDNDYIFRMKELDIPIKIVDVKYDHIGGLNYFTYYNGQLSALEKINIKIFKEKWGAKGWKCLPQFEHL